MSGIAVSVSQQLPLAAPEVTADPRLDGDEFDRSLRRLESPRPAPYPEQPAAGEPMPAVGLSRMDTLDQWSDVSEEGPVDTDEPPAPALTPNDERPTRQDGPRPDADAVLEVSALHTPSAPGVAAVEPLPGGTTAMTLHDFSLLLERTGAAVVSDGEQAWRFTLQDPALAVSRVALTREGAGHWSVALTVSGGSQPILSPHLQRLRERLEALGQGVTHVIVNREETP